MNRRALIMLVVGILFVPMSIPGQTQKQTSRHHFQLSCNTCHAPASTNANGTNTSVGGVKGDINQLCTLSGCHDFDPALNHPVGVRLMGVAPEDLPLDSYSNITCLTCHEEQGYSDDLNSDIKSNEYYLRRPMGVQLCSTCHLEINGTLAEQSHWRFSTRAHLGTIKTGPSSSNDLNQLLGDIDQESRTCLTCHDNVTVTIPPRHETYKQKKTRWKSMASHPIGMDYRYTALNKSQFYFYPSRDQKRIRLFNGKLGCGSCHSLYAQTKNNLVAGFDNDNSELCLKCHNL